jgi:hypothetical protein
MKPSSTPPKDKKNKKDGKRIEMTSMTCYIDPTQRSPSSISFKEISKCDAPHGIGTRQVSLHLHSPSFLLLAIVVVAFYFAFCNNPQSTHLDIAIRFSLRLSLRQHGLFVLSSSLAHTVEPLFGTDDCSIDNTANLNNHV